VVSPGEERCVGLRLQREQETAPYVFSSERGGPMSAKSFGTLFEHLGRRAAMAFTIFPHMLRHGCGYGLANAGHDTRALQAWLGHKNLQHTCAIPSWRRIGSRISGDSVRPPLDSEQFRSAPRTRRSFCGRLEVRKRAYPAGRQRS
jgi:Phage integrase family